MTRRKSTQPGSAVLALGLYLIWLGLAALSAWVAWQLHATLLYGAARWLHSDLPRPLGWTENQLVGISKLSILLLGSLWLMWIAFLEGHLRRHADQGHLIKRALQIALLLGGMLIVVYGIITITP